MGIKYQTIKRVIGKKLKKTKSYQTISVGWMRKKYKKTLRLLEMTKGEKRFLIFLTPDYRNLGDHAIYLAEREFLKKYFGKIKIIGITGSLYRKLGAEIKSHITERDIILITGGGFLGSLWQLENESFLDLVNYFKNNTIMVFPQTVYFYSGQDGDTLMKHMREVLKAHSRLFFCAREESTYILMTKNQLIPKERLLLVPDMVLFLKKVPESDRTSPGCGILFCLRKDKEKIRQEALVEYLKRKGNEKGVQISYTDTVESGRLYAEKMEEKLSEKWKLFSEYQLIITDRLHGMLFAAILGVPCLVMDNCSGKVEGTYRWLHQHDYIKMIKTLEDADNEFESLLEKKTPCRYDNNMLMPYFERLVSLIKKLEIQE